MGTWIDCAVTNKFQQHSGTKLIEIGTIASCTLNNEKLSVQSTRKIKLIRDLWTRTLIIIIVYRYFYFWTYCFISWALSPADGAVHWHIKYCKGTARTKTTNCSARGISVLQQLVIHVCNEEHSTQLRWSTRWRFFATRSPFTTFRDVVNETCQDMKLFTLAHRACKLLHRTTNH